MSYVARLYDSRQNAEAAAKELNRLGFDPNAIRVIEGSRTGAPATYAPEPAPEHDASYDPDAVPDVSAPGPAAHGSAASESHAEEMKKAGVAPAHAEIYAEGLRQGRTLLVVHPPFTMGEIAERVMDEHHPIAVNVPYVAYAPEVDWSGDAAPLSRALGWKVLSSDPAPLSSYLGWKTVLPEPASSASLETIRKQSQQAAPLSKALGMPTLSDNPDPLSSKTGLRTLTDDPAPLSGRLKWRTLLDDPAPLSGKLGWRTISQNAAPLSSLLGLPVLTRRQ